MYSQGVCRQCACLRLHAIRGAAEFEADLHGCSTRVRHAAASEQGVGAQSSSPVAPARRGNAPLQPRRCPPATSFLSFTWMMLPSPPTSSEMGCTSQGEGLRQQRQLERHCGLLCGARHEQRPPVAASRTAPPKPLQPDLAEVGPRLRLQRPPHEQVGAAVAHAGRAAGRVGQREGMWEPSPAFSLLWQRTPASEGAKWSEAQGVARCRQGSAD